MVYEKSFLGDSPEQGGLFLPSGDRKGRHVDNLTGGGRVAKRAGETGYRSSGSCFGLKAHLGALDAFFAACSNEDHILA